MSTAEAMRAWGSGAAAVHPSARGSAQTSLQATSVSMFSCVGGKWLFFLLFFFSTRGKFKTLKFRDKKQQFLILRLDQSLSLLQSFPNAPC